MPQRPLLTTVALLLAGLFAGGAHGQRATSRYVGKEFPNFSATDPISGDRFELKDFRGKVVLLDFWATWCGPCVRELPNVKSAYRKYRDRGFEVVSISLDSDQGKFKSFVRRNGMSWPQVMDGGGWSTRLAKKYGIRAIPAMFIIDHNGVCVTDSARGPRLERAIEDALGELEAAGGGKSAVRDDDEAAPRRENGAAAAQLARLADARSTLMNAKSPRRELDARLDGIDRSLRTLGDELPLPARPDAAAARYRRMHEDLVEVRRELFICGCLNDRVVVLPANPFGADGADLEGVELDRALVAAAAELPAARRAVAELRLGLAGESDHVRRLRGGLADLERQLRGDDVDVVALVARVDEIVAAVEDFEARCRDPWSAQLLVADAVVTQLAGGGETFTERADDLRRRVADCRIRFEEAQGTSSGMLALRDEFDDVCKDLAALAEDLRGTGVHGADAIDLPGNPLLGAAVRDLRVQIETREQIGRASRAIDDMSEMIGAADARIEHYRDAIREMQAEYARRRIAEASMNDLEQRFRALCTEVLAVLGDQAG